MRERLDANGEGEDRAQSPPWQSLLQNTAVLWAAGGAMAIVAALCALYAVREVHAALNPSPAMQQEIVASGVCGDALYRRGAAVRDLNTPRVVNGLRLFYFPNEPPDSPNRQPWRAAEGQLARAESDVQQHCRCVTGNPTQQAECRR